MTRVPVPELFFNMRKYSTQFRFLTALLVLTATIGCQSWQTSSILPGLTTTKGERLIKKQAKNDPFPSPSDVGFKGEE